MISTHRYFNTQHSCWGFVQLATLACLLSWRTFANVSFLLMSTIFGLVPKIRKILTQTKHPNFDANQTSKFFLKPNTRILSQTEHPNFVSNQTSEFCLKPNIQILTHTKNDTTDLKKWDNLYFEIDLESQPWGLAAVWKTDNDSCLTGGKKILKRYKGVIKIMRGIWSDCAFRKKWSDYLENVCNVLLYSWDYVTWEGKRKFKERGKVWWIVLEAIGG